MESFEPSSEIDFAPIPCWVELIPCCRELNSLFLRTGNSSSRASQTAEFADVFGTDFRRERPKSRKFPVVSLYGGQSHSRRLAARRVPRLGSPPRRNEVVPPQILRHPPLPPQRVVDHPLPPSHPEPRRTQRRCEFVRRHELLPAVGARGEPAQHVFRADDRQCEASQCAVE